MSPEQIDATALEDLITKSIVEFETKYPHLRVDSVMLDRQWYWISKDKIQVLDDTELTIVLQ